MQRNVLPEAEGEQYETIGQHMMHQHGYRVLPPNVQANGGVDRMEVETSLGDIQAQNV